jgi:hypothetical protein
VEKGEKTDQLRHSVPDVSTRATSYAGRYMPQACKLEIVQTPADGRGCRADGYRVRPLWHSDVLLVL